MSFISNAGRFLKKIMKFLTKTLLSLLVTINTIYVDASQGKGFSNSGYIQSQISCYIQSQILQQNWNVCAEKRLTAMEGQQGKLEALLKVQQSRNAFIEAQLAKFAKQQKSDGGKIQSFRVLVEKMSTDCNERITNLNQKLEEVMRGALVFDVSAKKDELAKKFFNALKDKNLVAGATQNVRAGFFVDFLSEMFSHIRAQENEIKRLRDECKKIDMDLGYFARIWGHQKGLNLLDSRFAPENAALNPIPEANNPGVFRSVDLEKSSTASTKDSITLESCGNANQKIRNLGFVADVADVADGVVYVENLQLSANDFQNSEDHLPAQILEVSKEKSHKAEMLINNVERDLLQSVLTQIQEAGALVANKDEHETEHERELVNKSLALCGEVEVMLNESIIANNELSENITQRFNLEEKLSENIAQRSTLELEEERNKSTMQAVRDGTSCVFTPEGQARRSMNSPYRCGVRGNIDQLAREALSLSQGIEQRTQDELVLREDMSRKLTELESKLQNLVLEERWKNFFSHQLELEVQKGVEARMLEVQQEMQKKFEARMLEMQQDIQKKFEARLSAMQQREYALLSDSPDTMEGTAQPESERIAHEGSSQHDDQKEPVVLNDQGTNDMNQRPLRNQENGDTPAPVVRKDFTQEALQELRSQIAILEGKIDPLANFVTNVDQQALETKKKVEEIVAKLQSLFPKISMNIKDLKLQFKEHLNNKEEQLK